MNWYYLEQGQQRGPLSEAEFSALTQQGMIRPDTQVWREGMPDWKPYRELSLAESSSQAPPAAAPAPAPAASVNSSPASARPAADTESLTSCSRCGVEVPASQTVTIGTMSLCPKCQVGYQREVQRAAGAYEEPVVYASPFARLAAFVMDNLLCSLVAVGLVIGAGWHVQRFLLDEKTARWIIGGAFLLSVLWVLHYFVGRIARQGATPAMKLFKIKVVNRDRKAPGYLRAFARYLVLSLVTSLTLGLGHVVAFFDKERRSLHDWACGTIVIKT